MKWSQIMNGFINIWNGLYDRSLIQLVDLLVSIRSEGCGSISDVQGKGYV